jgi:hypothetical protein
MIKRAYSGRVQVWDRAINEHLGVLVFGLFMFSLTAIDSLCADSEERLWIEDKGAMIAPHWLWL